MTTPLDITPLKLNDDDIDISQPLDEHASPDLISTFLSPVYSTPSLNLILDYYVQSQSISNNLIIWNSKNFIIFFTLVSSYGFYLIHDNYEIIGVIKSMTYNSGSNIFSLSYFVILLISTYLIFLKNFNNYFQNESKKLAITNASELFTENVNLQELVKLNEKRTKSDDDSGDKKLSKDEEKLLENCENVKLFIYRKVPIAIIILNPYNQIPDSDEFTVKIMGLNVRNVYKNIGLYDDLIEWAIKRSITLNEVYNKKQMKSKSNEVPNKLKSKLKLTVDVYSFHSIIRQSLLKYKFKLVEKSYLPTFLGSFYKISNDSYELLLDLNESSAK